MCIAPLEIHFPKIGAESILEYITLAGGLLPGHRIVSFVRNTITFILVRPAVRMIRLTC